MSNDEDKRWMKLALSLAKRGNPSPNPHVGAVVVKNGKLIGKGYHRKCGLAHAEVEALGSMENNADAKGATLYSTLEPCNHYGKTPPCTKAINDAGISRVVFAMKDPNPKVEGNGETELKKAGIEVASGIMEAEAEKLNPIFIKYAKTGIPYVTLKIAMSMDGKIATRSGDSRWISGEKARRYAHRLRSEHDAVMVGAGTVIADNPQLTARIRGGRNPIKIVIDGKLSIPLEAGLLKEGKIIVAASSECNYDKKRKLEEMGVEVLISEGSRVEPKKLLAALGGMGISSILVEGGSEVQGMFLDARAIDRLVLVYSPILIGGRDAKVAFAGEGAARVADALKVNVRKIKRLGSDIVFECEC